MSRAVEEQTLAMIKLRASGLTSVEIAAQFCVSQEYVRTATNRVMNADAAESGEDVSAAYWGLTSGPKRRIAP